MKKFMSSVVMVAIAAVLAVGLHVGPGVTTAQACGWTTEVVKTASIQRYYTGNGTYGHIGLSLSAVENTCFPSSANVYYHLSSWVKDGFNGASIYYFMTFKIRAWDCGTYKGTWTTNTSGFSGGASTPDMYANCQYQSDDLNTSLYSGSLTPGPGQAAVTFGAYLNINEF